MHPYSFVARVGFQELLATSDASAKTPPLLPKLIPPIRAAMVSCVHSTVSTHKLLL